jgi:hypothetical protein
MSFLSQNLSFARLQDRSWRKRHNTLLYLQRVLLVVCILIWLVLEVWLLILHPVEVTWLLWREQVIIRVHSIISCVLLVLLLELYITWSSLISVTALLLLEHHGQTFMFLVLHRGRGVRDLHGI